MKKIFLPIILSSLLFVSGCNEKQKFSALPNELQEITYEKGDAILNQKTEAASLIVKINKIDIAGRSYSVSTIKIINNSQLPITIKKESVASSFLNKKTNSFEEQKLLSKDDIKSIVGGSRYFRGLAESLKVKTLSERINDNDNERLKREKEDSLIENLQILDAETIKPGDSIERISVFEKTDKGTYRVSLNINERVSDFTFELQDIVNIDKKKQDEEPASYLK